MYTVKKEKDELRKTYRELRSQIGDAERARRDSAICRAATSLASYRFADCILMYAPTREEIDVMPIALDALAKGKRIAFPKCDPESRTMDYHFITSIDELQKGYFDILEPPEDAPIFDREADGARTVCFVPGLLYDAAGYRLGYGKGFYDRYLSSFSGNAVGVVYSDFIVQSVPRGRFDVSLKILLTEKGVFVTGEN